MDGVALADGACSSTRPAGVDPEDHVRLPAWTGTGSHGQARGRCSAAGQDWSVRWLLSAGDWLIRVLLSIRLLSKRRADPVRALRHRGECNNAV
jgi:hypothetical protein